MQSLRRMSMRLKAFRLVNFEIIILSEGNNGRRIY